ncbi:MAG: hypothetical protein CL840_18735 [Crocinitomicaceae bacterium]|nr:hypothetical protein [Crocinitomicaceae bacterium]|tara:strand:- start:786 stop:1337 length:552 start_codon:yes stop_codon:yes gene_type:complete
MGSKTFFNIMLVMLLPFASNVKAQEVYSSTIGTVHITGVWNDSIITAISNELIVLLNYETARFEMRLDKSTLRTGIDSLDKELKELEGNILVYEGKLGIEYVQTQSHPPQDFEVEGYLTCAPHNENIIGKGRLKHIFEDVYSCILNMTFHLNLKEINLDIDLFGLDDEIRVEIIQTVLKRKDE